MISRILPPDEWPRLRETSASEVWPHLNPAHNLIVVVEEGDAIVGSAMLMDALHAEFAWIAPDHRGKTAVARRLRDRLLTEARATQRPTLLMAAMSDQMRHIIHTLGATPLPGDHFVLTLKGAC